MCGQMIHVNEWINLRDIMPSGRSHKDFKYISNSRKAKTTKAQSTSVDDRCWGERRLLTRLGWRSPRFLRFTQNLKFCPWYTIRVTCSENVHSHFILEWILEISGENTLHGIIRSNYSSSLAADCISSFKQMLDTANILIHGPNLVTSGAQSLGQGTVLRRPVVQSFVVVHFGQGTHAQGLHMCPETFLSEDWASLRTKYDLKTNKWWFYWELMHYFILKCTC